jgi:cobalt-zinc-cadmium efflux system outer membrane protein
MFGIACPDCRGHAQTRVLRVLLLWLVWSALTLAPAGAQTAVPAPGPALPAGRTWTLEQVVTAAISQHPLVEAARARVDAARGERLTAGALPNPIGTFWMENTGFPGQDLRIPINRETSTYVTWPLEPFIQRSSRLRHADEDVKVAEASLTLARRHVAAEAVQAFFHVALAQALAEEAEENRDRLDQLASYNRVRVDEGVTAEGELLRIQLELDGAATAVAFAEVELTRARAEVAPYLGNVGTNVGGPMPIRVDVPNAVASGPSALPAFDRVLVRARQQRPELVASRARVASAAAATDVERALSVRQVGATLGNKRVEGQNSMVLGVSIAVPLFNRNRGGVERATNERLAVEHELAWTERTIAANVQGAYESATRLARRLADLQQSYIARAEDVHRLTLGAYQEGGVTLLQVLDATRVLADARLTYVRTLLAHRQSLFALALASGAEPGDALTLLQDWSASLPASAATGASK